MLLYNPPAFRPKNNVFLRNRNRCDALSCGCLVEVLRYEVMYLRFV